MDRSKDASSSGSSKQTSRSTQRASGSSRGTHRTSSTQATSVASSGRRIASGIASMQIETPPEPHHNTRSRTGALKRKDPEPAESTTNPPREKKRGRKSASASDSAKPPPNIGSPWDVTIRKKLRVEDLDLDKSYVGLSPDLSSAPKSERPQRQKRWRHQGEPLTDPKKLPRDWNAREPDLDDEYVLIKNRLFMTKQLIKCSDIEAQIERCHERLEDNIMPHLFQYRLEEYEARKSHLEELSRNEPSGLSRKVYERLDDLKIIQAGLEKEGDQYNQLPNIKAIMSAYRLQKLDWNGSGMVTYWSKGTQLCQPRPFDWDEFEAINSRHEGHSSFWAEGFTGPRPVHSMPSITLGSARNDAWLHEYNVAVRLPGYDWWTELVYIYDTGASLMNIYQDDFKALMGACRPPAYPEIPVIDALKSPSLMAEAKDSVSGSELDVMLSPGLPRDRVTHIQEWMVHGYAVCYIPELRQIPKT
ncbi:uncharacterized protein N7459_004961 [Penicillium hispanicum]|uniref:uncharacterized protein n=1 Tax=Penicillium hispanicum TaxID=1080232 RepID=UPI00254075DC|nr:uncharacterized protein N7459_004961 [Penicillium hispanicum]KAJ5585161.1 hypothetical protein N7459_004961 [Penicillium hispanicum]